MGKSGASCFRIISCGRDQHDEDDLSRHEIKPPVDKHRWSFKRKSSQRQSHDDCVISEPILVSVSRKETAEAKHESSHPSNSYKERLTVAKCLEDTPSISPPLADNDASDSLSTSDDNIKSDNNLSEPAVIVIQSAARAYLARKDLQRNRSAVKLQAAVRGHLTRRQAVGTLRCVQAIVKMQALVRARRKRLLGENLTKSGADDAKDKQDRRFDLLESGNLGGTKEKIFSSTETILRNGFARLLLESKPKAKPIYISCDPLKPDSAWKWLERWMAAGLTYPDEEEQNVRDCQKQGNGEINDNGLVTSSMQSKSSTCIPSFSTFSRSHFSGSEGEIKALVDGKLSFVESQKIQSETPSTEEPKAKEEIQEMDEGIKGELNTPLGENSITEKPDANRSGMTVPSDLEIKLGPLSNQLSPDTWKMEGTEKIIDTEELQNDHKKPVHELEMATVPEVAAVKLEIDELPLVSLNPISPLSHESTIINEIPPISNPCSHDETQHTDGWSEPVVKATEREENDVICHDDSACYTAVTTESEEYLSASAAHMEQKLAEGSNGSHDIEISSVTVDQLKEPPDGITDSFSAVDQQAYRSSPETTPRSHVNATESFETPSSQISTSDKISKTDTGLTIRKQKAKLTSTKSPPSRNTTSTTKSMSVLSRNDSKNMKDDSATGELDDMGHKPRTSISNPLPSYMQTTESARAKFHSSSSPRACADDDDNDNKYTRKRLSLPSGMEDPSSQVEQEAFQVRRSFKSNARHSPQKPAERRWIR